jgi:hypothetical protein
MGAKSLTLLHSFQGSVLFMHYVINRIITYRGAMPSGNGNRWQDFGEVMRGSNCDAGEKYQREE